MHLRKNRIEKTGRTYLSIVHGYRDKNSKKAKSVTVKTLGYLDELEKEHADPIAHFEQVVKEMNEQEQLQKAPVTFNINISERLSQDSTNRKNFGYVAISKIYHELQLDTFFTNKQRYLKADYNTNNIMKLLVFSRLLDPSSKKKAFENKERFFENSDFSLDDIYRSLSHFNKHEKDAQLWIHNQITEQYNRDTKLVYYDVTNYYFEIDEPDELRRKGICKEHRPNPIIQMGLAMDTMGIPIAYKLFKGNESDKTTLIPMLKELRREYNLGRIIVVADKGLNTGDNIHFNTFRKDGYVYSQTVRGANAEFKSYVLNENGYEWYGKDYKRKSRIYPREITFTDNGVSKTETVDEKQVVFYSRDYDVRAKAERAPAVAKAMNLIENPGKFKKATSFGAVNYIKDLVFDKKTGEIITAGHKPSLDLEKIKKEEEMDGYYAIVTSEFKETDERIIEMYRGLWRIEESFRVTKSDLETRPVYLSSEDHIRAHFLTCYIALVIARILQHKVGNKFSVGKIMESLNKVSCSHEQQNYYLFDYCDEVTEAIGNAIGIDFGMKYMKLGEIKKILGEVKKV
jgi:transposase